MSLHIGRPHRALIVAPHPDDEVIGATALIQALRRRGTRITVAIVSDGAASHPNSRIWPRHRLVAARRQESLRALARLGVCKGAVRFLDLPDGALDRHLPACLRPLRTATASFGPRDLIVGPAATDGHPDHRAVAATLARVRGGAARLTYQVWPPANRRPRRALAVRMPGGCAAKRSLIRLHRTQSGAIDDDPHGFAIARHELDAFAHPIEYFVPVRR